ncbi:MAG: hypothetical protein ACE363_15810 [Alphaproteobacteria bacterium]
MGLRRANIFVGAVVAGLGFGIAGCGDQPNSQTDDALENQATVTVLGTEEPLHPPIPLSICPDPQDCTSLGRVSIGHGDAGIAVYHNPDLEDEVTRWADATGGIISCTEAGQSLSDCVATSAMPEPCKLRFSASAGNATPVAAFQQVFLTEGSGCGPGESVIQ